jgi:acyl carrier protein
MLRLHPPCIGEAMTLNAVAASTQDRVADIVLDLLARRNATKTVLPENDLREKGLTSLDMVNLMLAIEAEFDLRIPEAQMTPQNFRSISAIDALVATLLRSR